MGLAAQVEGWPDYVREIQINSTSDGTDQPSIMFVPDGDEPVPLLVALHTWSGTYKQTYSTPYVKFAKEKGWAFIHPDYRGPNRTPESTGSELVLRDVLDAVEFMKTNYAIDNRRIYLIGGSGGGYNALHVVSRAPEVWAGVSVWVPISDLEAWYYENMEAGRHYANDIVGGTGGIPGSSPEVNAEYKKRSPVYHLAGATGVSIHIAAGIRDGYTGSVPVSHSIRAFNALAHSRHHIHPSEINYFVKEAEVPPELVFKGRDLSFPSEKPVLFRRTSGNTILTIFDGGHDTLYETGLTWLEKKRK
ncbi:MAG: prolyl oligopeptidase family serine peptidase [Bacteroidota bacterium]